MNLYLRYFDDETLVHDVEEALVFLSNLDEIEITPELEADLREYVESADYYPKRGMGRGHYGAFPETCGRCGDGAIAER